MYSQRDALLTEKELLDALKIVRASELGVRKTPCILGLSKGDSKGLDFFDTAHFEYENLFDPLPDCSKIYFKLENLQRTGSFKIRGISAQVEEFTQRFSKSGPNGRNKFLRRFVTMSAGNYGRAVAFAAYRLGMKGTVIMPVTAPDNRAIVIKEYGVDVVRMPSADLNFGVKKLEEEEDAIFLHSFDDLNLIAGHGSLGFEILEDVPDADVVLVCCGGGGLLAGVAAAIKLVKPDVTIYGIEPETACGVYKSFQAGRAVQCPESKSIASGLAPPFVGENAFRHIKEYVKGIILVSEEELKAAVDVACRHGLVVEPAGAAGLAALLSGKLLAKEGSLADKNIVIVLTGGNVTPEELDKIVKL